MIEYFLCSAFRNLCPSVRSANIISKLLSLIYFGFQNYVRSILTCVFVCVGLYCSTLSCALSIIHVVDFRVLMLSHFDFGFSMYVSDLRELCMDLLLLCATCL